MDENMDNKGYLRENGIPKHLRIQDEAIGEWVGLGADKCAFRVLLEITTAYGVYSKEVAKKLIRCFYDDQLHEMYVSQVHARLRTGEKVQSFGAFLELPIPKEIVAERNKALKTED